MSSSLHSQHHRCRPPRAVPVFVVGPAFCPALGRPGGWPQGPVQALQQPLLPVLLPALPGSSSSGLGVTTQAAWVERSPLLVSLCFSVRASSSLLSSQPDRWRGRPSLVCNVCLFSPFLLSLQTLCTLQGPEVRARQRPTGQPWLQELTPDPTLLLKRFWMLMAFCVLLGNGVGGGRGSEPAVRTPLFGGMVATPLSGETSLWGEPLPLCWGTEPTVPGVCGHCPKPVGPLGPRCTVGTWQPSKAEAPPLSQVCGEAPAVFSS